MIHGITERSGSRVALSGAGSGDSASGVAMTTSPLTKSETPNAACNQQTKLPQSRILGALTAQFFAVR